MNKLEMKGKKLNAELNTLKGLLQNLEIKNKLQVKRVFQELERMEKRPNNLGVYNLIKIEQEKLNTIRSKMKTLLANTDNKDYKKKMTKLVAELKKSTDEIKKLNILGNTNK